MIEQDSGAAEAAADDHLLVEEMAEDGAAIEAPEPDEGEDEPAPSPGRNRVQARIDELTRDKYAERRAREAAEQELARLRGGANGPPRGEPDPSHYEGGEADPAFIRDLSEHTARAAFERIARQEAMASQARAVERDWSERQQAFARETAADYYEVFDRHWVCTTPMAEAIKTSDSGAAVAYHLALYPDEAQRIANLAPLAQVREIGRIEARLARSSPGRAGKLVSDAPAPHPRARGAGSRHRAAPDTDDFAAFERTYGEG